MKAVHLRFESGRPSLLQWLAGCRAHAAGRVGTLLLIAAAGALAFEGWQLAQARQELAAVEGELQARGELRTVAVAPRPSLKPEERRAWNQLAAQLNAPWAALLAGLEAATPDHVALVSIEPDARRGSVRVQAEAKTLEALLAYAEALKRVEPFTDVLPLQHETNEQDANRPVRVTLQLRLRAAPAPARAPGEAR